MIDLKSKKKHKHELKRKKRRKYLRMQEFYRRLRIKRGSE